MQNFIEEVEADRFALTQIANLPNYTGAIDNYKIARAVSSVHGSNANHLTGLAVEKLNENSPPKDYRLYFETAESFTEKVRTKATEINSRNLSINFSPEVFKLLGLAHTFTLWEGVALITQLQDDGKFNSLENEMAEQYLNSAKKWMDPALKGMAHKPNGKAALAAPTEFNI